MDTLLEIVIWWFAISIPCSLLIGRAISRSKAMGATGKEGKSMPPSACIPLEQFSAEVSPLPVGKAAAPDRRAAKDRRDRDFACYGLVRSH